MCVVGLGGFIPGNITAGEDLGQLTKSLGLAGQLLRTDIGMMPVLQHKNLSKLRRNTDSPLGTGGQHLIPVVMSQKPA
jgi:hypothetical protein